MYRKIYKELIKWKNSKERKPLILQGARQVGKTYIVNIFGKNEYKNVIYCNFEQENGLDDFFNDFDVNRILIKISAYKRKEIFENETLLIFDEIQASPKVITALKYFCEKAPNIHIIATGSLLGVAVNRKDTSFPVGKVQFLTMYPMDFEEFLMAYEDSTKVLLSEIQRCYDNNSPMDKLFHEQAIELYKQFLYVGGMPEVVECFIKTNSYELVRVKQKELITAYFNDMSKYNKATEIPKTKLVYQNISRQLAKENRKFQYSLIKTGARASMFEEAIEWLCLTGIAHRVYKLDNVALPLNSNSSISDFKFYMGDVGLCCASQEVLFDDLLLDNNDFEFRGGLTENYVANQLLVNDFISYYWTSKFDAEIDFIVRIDKNIIPIEVKSKDNVKSKSLGIYRDRFNPNYSIRISTKNFGFENGIKSVPLYAVFCIK